MNYQNSIMKISDNFFWTLHSRAKMSQYQLSESRVKRVIRYPQRIEEGIAPKTIAVMQRNDTPRRQQEIWVMYQKINKKLRIIAAWRYPGKSPLRQAPPIPEDILEELSQQKFDKSNI